MAAALLRPERAPSLPLGPRLQAPGKCSARRHGPRPSEKHAAGRVAGRGRSPRRPRFFRLRLHISRSPVSAPCSPIPDPRSLIPDRCSRTPALRPDPGWSLGGAASLAPLWPLLCGPEPFPLLPCLKVPYALPKLISFLEIQTNRFPSPAQPPKLSDQRARVWA